MRRWQFRKVHCTCTSPLLISTGKRSNGQSIPGCLEPYPWSWDGPLWFGVESRPSLLSSSQWPRHSLLLSKTLCLLPRDIGHYLVFQSLHSSKEYGEIVLFWPFLTDLRTCFYRKFCEVITNVSKDKGVSKKFVKGSLFLILLGTPNYFIHGNECLQEKASFLTRNFTIEMYDTCQRMFEQVTFLLILNVVQFNTLLLCQLNCNIVFRHHYVSVVL